MDLQSNAGVSDMVNAERIVAMLNAEPLQYSISLLDFCQQTTQQKQELLFYVLSNIQDSNHQDWDGEDDEGKMGCVLELLRVLNYRPTLDRSLFKQGLADGSTEVYYPLLAWLLPQMEILKKRAYLARFLVDVEMPPELLLEDDVTTLSRQYEELRGYFKTTHKHLESLRREERDMVSYKEQVKALDIEKEHLHRKLLKLNNELQDVEKVGEIVDEIKSLRENEALETNLNCQLQEQVHALAFVSAEEGKVTSKFHFVEELATCGSISKLLQNMSHVCSLLRYSTKDKLPKELEAKRFRLQALQEVLDDPNQYDNRLSTIQAQLLEVNEELKAIKSQRESEQGVKGVSEVQRQQVQMSMIIANKISNAFERLATLTHCKDKLIVELEQKLQAIEEVKGTVRRGEDLKQYVELLRNKSTMYKEFKKEIDEMAAEYGVLLRTQQLLEQQAVGVPNFVDIHGAPFSGFTNELSSPHTTNNTTAEGEMKSSKIVWKQILELDESLHEQQAKVALFVKDLKDMRMEVQEREATHASRKQQYNEVSLSCERKCSRLEAEVVESCREHEANAKYLQETNLEIEELEVVLDQLSREMENGALSEELCTKISLEEESAIALQQKQQKLKEMEHANKTQVDMMKDLLTLLAAKLALYSSCTKPAIYSTNSSLQMGEEIQLPSR